MLAHVFSDAPILAPACCTPTTTSLLATLRACAQVSGVQWVVKPHPSASLYGEDGMVEKMVGDAGARNVVVCPRDLNTRSLCDCADALVTVHGTAGLEFACLGIPTVLAGRPFYRGFGFTIEPATLEEYGFALAGLAKAVPLSEERKQRALEVYAVWDRQSTRKPDHHPMSVGTSGEGQAAGNRRGLQLYGKSSRFRQEVKLGEFAQAYPEAWDAAEADYR